MIQRIVSAFRTNQTPLPFGRGMGVGCMAFALLFLTSCKNGDQDFPDYEGGTTAYFAYQYPVRTIILGDDEYDTTGDHQGKFRILSTFGGTYNGAGGTVQVAVDPTLCDNLTFEDGTPVQAMPAEYYSLASTSWKYDINGGMNGGTEVQLSEAFFNDAKAVGQTYVIPLVMTSQTGFGRIATGTLKEGGQAIRTDASQWEVQPMDYVLYCVKFQNKYSGYWLTHHTTSTENIEKASEVQVKCRSLRESVYTVSHQEGDHIYTADLLLSFDASDQCTITSLTSGVTASGNGSWTDDGEKKSWNNKDRDLMELTYSIDFGSGVTYSNQEKLVWYRSGVTAQEFSPIYVK